MEKQIVEVFFWDHRGYYVETDKGIISIYEGEIKKGEDLARQINENGASIQSSWRDPFQAFRNKIKRIIADIDAKSNESLMING
jgi:hypothetical protein